MFSIEICALSLLAGLLLIVFGGITDRLIPLFAVGAFTAFTLSQTGMVMYWKKKGGPGVRRSILINGAGALATGLTTCVVIVAKFADGAWIAVLAIPGLVLLMSVIRHHYERILRELEDRSPAKLSGISPPIVVVPLKRWSKIAKKALRFAYALSQDVFVVHFEPNRPTGTEDGSELEKKWIRARTCS